MTTADDDKPALRCLERERSVLVLVDYQQRLLPAIHQGDTALAQALRLADVALALGLPVVGTEQNPRGLGPSAAAVHERCVQTLPKMHFDACADGLVAALAALRPTQGQPALDIVIAGCEAHVCLLQTALGLLRSGARVWVAADACGSRRASDHALAMARLQAAGAVVASVEAIAFEWLRSCEDPAFRTVLERLKQPA